MSPSDGGDGCQGAPPRRPSKETRILIIDDEPEVRALLAELLAAHGYRVIEAGDGREGLARCEAEPVDLVLSDLSLPGMSGWAIAAWCRARFPGLPVGFITGSREQIDAELLDRLDRYGVRFVLGKPFEMDAVLREVAAVLPEA